MKSMQWKPPKNSDKYQWTQHSLIKMQYYGLSPQRITRVIKSPARIEEGIVENTIAVMQPVSIKTDKNRKRVWSSEIWVMYQLKVQSPKSKVQSQFTNYQLQTINQKIKIISAWRYPGVSPERDPIPEEILAEIRNLL